MFLSWGFWATRKAGRLWLIRLFKYGVLRNLCRASPRLKDAQIEASEYSVLYAELLLNIHRMYHHCKLVHADLSEYNILYHDSHLYIIDVSQSVEHDHPSAFDFLRNDLKNVEEFFGRFGVRCLGLRRCFEFVTREKLSDNEEDGIVLKQWLEETQPNDDHSANSLDSISNQATAASAHEDRVFMQSYIPRTLNEVYDPERDAEDLKNGEGRGLIYADTIGLVDFSNKSDSKAEVHSGEANDEDDEASLDGSESDGSGEDVNSIERTKERAPRGHRHEDREAKKVCSPS
jgi:RIO kinase 1